MTKNLQCQASGINIPALKTSVVCAGTYEAGRLSENKI